MISVDTATAIIYNRAMMSNLERLGIPIHKVQRTIGLVDFITSDGFSYVIRQARHRVVVFSSEKEYDALRVTSGELKVTDSKGRLIATISLWKLPKEGGLIEGINIKVPGRSMPRYTTVAIGENNRDLFIDLMGQVERSLGRSFHSMEEFLVQAVLTLSARHIISVQSHRWTRYDWTASCPKCGASHQLHEKNKHGKIVWLVDCNCGARFIVWRTD